MRLSSIKGSELKKWRRSRGWSRRYLAENLGVSESALWKWERPEADVPIVFIGACLAFEAKLEWPDV